MFKGLIDRGFSLLTGDFDAAFKGESAIIDPSTHATPDGAGWSFTSGDGSFQYFKYSTLAQCEEAYYKCPAVSAVINKKAQCFIDAKVWVLNSKGKEAVGVRANAVRNLIKNPNFLQTQQEFLAQTYVYVQLYGYCPVIAIKRLGFKENYDAKSLWNIPPTMIDWDYTRKLYKQSGLNGAIKEIVLNYEGERSIIPVEDVCIIRDLSPTLHGNMIFPDSRIKTLEMAINNSIGALESRNVLINYRGALGIFSRETGASQGMFFPPVSNEEKEQLQDDFRRYGLRKKQWQFIITSAGLKWQQISVPTKDLMLFEEVDAGTMAICDRYNYPYQLMAAAKGTTFANVAEGHKILYTGAIIPEATSIFTQLGKFFGLEKDNLYLDADYSAVAVLQKDRAAEATAQKTLDDAFKIEWENDVCTLNEWRLALGRDPLEGTIGNLRRSALLSLPEVPLYLSLGSSGTQQLLAVVSSNTLSEDAGVAILETVFKIPSATAIRMMADRTPQNNNQTTNDEQTTEDTTTEDGAEEDTDEEE